MPPYSLPLRVSGALAYINTTEKTEKSKIAVSELCAIDNAVVPVTVVINTFAITANAVAIFAAVIIVAATDAMADADIVAAEVNADIISMACRHE